MRVLEGADGFEEPDDWELEGLKDLETTVGGAAADVRLACQALVRGDATVRKAGVKPLPGPLAVRVADKPERLEPKGEQ
jgi:ferredoxin